MKKTILTFVLGFGISFLSFGQRADLSLIEIGGYVGSITYSGDVATTLHPSAVIKEVRPEFGIHIKNFFNYYYGIGIEASYGEIFAMDVNHSNKERGYIVETPIIQVNVFGEFHLKKFGKYFRRNKSTPFIKTGVGFISGEPKMQEVSLVNFKNYDVNPTGIKTLQFSIGAGYKWRLGRYSSLQVSYEFHHIFTDDLEGVSLKNNQSRQDVYGGIQVGFNYLLFKELYRF